MLPTETLSGLLPVTIYITCCVWADRKVCLTYTKLDRCYENIPTQTFHSDLFLLYIHPLSKPEHRINQSSLVKTGNCVLYSIPVSSKYSLQYIVFMLKMCGISTVITIFSHAGHSLSITFSDTGTVLCSRDCAEIDFLFKKKHAWTIVIVSTDGQISHQFFLNCWPFATGGNQYSQCHLHGGCKYWQIEHNVSGY